MTSYGQFCPVAKAMEVLDERWTLLVVRELLAGSTRFNELRRGVPKMSPALLSKRLHTLERTGIVRRAAERGRTSYTLSESGRELADVVQALSAWGARWVSDLGDEDLDPHLLLWDIRRTVAVDPWPRSRTVVGFRFDDVQRRVASWWLVVSGSDVDVCDVDPGYEETAVVATGLRTLTRIWRGDTSWSQALRAGTMTITAPERIRRAVPRWIGQSTLAAIPRPTASAGV